MRSPSSSRTVSSTVRLMVLAEVAFMAAGLAAAFILRDDVDSMAKGRAGDEGPSAMGLTNRGKRFVRLSAMGKGTADEKAKVEKFRSVG